MKEFKELDNLENFIKSAFNVLPRKRFPAGHKEKVWLKIQAQIRQPKPELAHAQKSGVFGWLKLSGIRRLQIKIAAVALIVLTTLSIAGGAARANPGEVLYTVKKAAERVERVLATNEEAKVKVEIKHAKRRLQEVQILVAENKDAKIVSDTLAELNTRTMSAVAVTEQKPELTSVVADLANHEESVLQEVHGQAEGELKEALQQALIATKESADKLKPTEIVEGTNSEETMLPSTNTATTTPTNTQEVSIPAINTEPKSNDGVIESIIQIDNVTRIGDEPEKESEGPTVLPEPTINF